MDMQVFYLYLLFATDALLYIIARWLQTSKWARRRDALPVSLVLPLTACAVSAHIGVTVALERASDAFNTQDRFLVIGSSAAGGIIPACVYALMLVRSLSHACANMLFGMHTATPPANDLSRPRALRSSNRINEALSAYWRCFSEMPESPTPLFEAGNMLAEEERYNDAADIFREIIRRFRDHNATWAKASFRLADLFENYLGERETAVFLLKEIVKRVPDSRDARLARERIAIARERGQEEQEQEQTA